MLTKLLSTKSAIIVRIEKTLDIKNKNTRYKNPVYLKTESTYE